MKTVLAMAIEQTFLTLRCANPASYQPLGVDLPGSHFEKYRFSQIKNFSAKTQLFWNEGHNIGRIPRISAQTTYLYHLSFYMKTLLTSSDLSENVFISMGPAVPCKNMVTFLAFFSETSR